MTMQEIAEQLTRGDGNPLVRNITLIPGWTIEDFAEVERRVTVLMGDKVEPRRNYISQYADFNKVDNFQPVTGAEA